MSTTASNIVCILLVALFAGGGYLYYRGQQELLRTGRIIKRQAHFWEDSELLYSAASYPDVLAALEKTDFSFCGVHISANVGGRARVLFERLGWKAALDYYGENSGEHAYAFQFLSWKVRNYAAQDTTNMNMLQTAVEKMFLQLDPDTEAEIRRSKVKTKTEIV